MLFRQLIQTHLKHWHSGRNFGDKKGAEIQTVPKIIVDQLATNPEQYPLTVEWKGEKYVVVNISGLEDVIAGDITLAEYKGQLGISPAKYFNLEQ